MGKAFWLQPYLAQYAVGLSLTLGFIPVWADDYGPIRLANQDSIIYIHSEKLRKDGVGAPEHSYGTGFIISDTGHVVTASHVILEEDRDSIVKTTGAIRSGGNHAYPLELIKRDDLDVAVLILPDGDNWKPVSFGNSKKVPKDASLYTLGFPGTIDMLPATGILGSKNGPKGLWITTLPINRGNSGGPIFDLTGKVVAIASGGADDRQAVTYAIPESYFIGIRQIAANVRMDQLVASKTDDSPSIAKTFSFYSAVDHEAAESRKQSFCLPSDYVVTSVKPTVTTINGSDTKLVSVIPDPQIKNCVSLDAFIKGSGVVKIGPIVVDHRGRGWLGVDLAVEGKKRE